MGGLVINHGPLNDILFKIVFGAQHSEAVLRVSLDAPLAYGGPWKRLGYLLAAPL